MLGRKDRSGLSLQTGFTGNKRENDSVLDVHVRTGTHPPTHLPTDTHTHTQSQVEKKFFQRKTKGYQVIKTEIAEITENS